MPQPVTLDFSKAQPVNQGPVKLDFSRSQPISGGAPDATTSEGAREWRGAHAPAPEPSSGELFKDALFDPLGSGASAYPKPIEAGLQTLGRAFSGIVSPFSHPLQAAKSTGSMVREIAQDAPNSPFYNPAAEALHPGPLVQRMEQFGKDWHHSPSQALANAAGDALGAFEGGRMLGGAWKTDTGALGAKMGLPGEVGIKPGFQWARTAAAGDPNAAGLRVMGVPSSSTGSLRAIRALGGARPFLKGTQSIADAQTTIPAAKAEIWAPYEQAINEIGDRPVKGPDGMTTVRALEEERLRLSALNRALHTGDPAARQLAEQQGFTSKADALEREEKIQRALDPELGKAGIKPREIRRAFGQVSQVGSRLMGRSTVAEPSQPYGFGRMANLRLDRPRTWIGQPAQGVRDVFAGRPLWSGKPSDVNIREAFRAGGEKPDFGTVSPQNRLKLPAQVPLREGEFDGDWQFGVPNEPQATPVPRAFAALPERAGAGEAQPMVWGRAPSHPGVEEAFARERVRPSVFAPAGEARSAGGAVTPAGQVMPRVRGLLPGGFHPLDLPPDEAVPIWPRGSSFGGEEQPELYPRGSRFGKRTSGRHTQSEQR